MAHAFFIRGERVGEAEAARVVKVRALQLPADLLFHPGEKPPDLSRIGIAHRVGERDAVAELARARQRCAPRRPPARCPAWCSRTRSTRRPRSRPRGAGCCAHLRTSSTISSGVMRTLDTLCSRLADTGKVTLCAPASSARWKPFRFGASATTLRPRNVHRNADDLGRVGHGRNQLGRNERADLDLAQPRVGERADPGLLRLGGHEVLRVLQAVARPDFADVDVRHAVSAPRFSSTTRPVPNCGPMPRLNRPPP